MSPPVEQQIRFCTSRDGVRIAHATVGSGPPLVKAANWLSHVEFDSHSPVWRHWIRDLSRYHTLVRYDERGCGLSDWAIEEFSLDAWVRDLEAVMDALELERFPLLGISQGGPIAIAYAARHPERVSQLVLYGSYARGRSHRNLSDREREERELMLRMITVGWGQDHAAFRQVFTSLFIPDATPEQAHWFNELQRVSATPENAARMVSTFDSLDVRALAPGLDTPTLVLHATGDLRVPFEEGRLLASLIPGARFVPLDGRNHILLESEPAWPRFLREIREFFGVEETRPAASVARTPSTPTAATLRRRVEAVFDEAIELATADRPAFLARACADDAECRREVELMLQLAEQSGLTAKLAGAVAGAVGRIRYPHGSSSPDSAVPDAIDRLQAAITDRYVLGRELGRGGMATVYLAQDLKHDRPVAIKVLHPDLAATLGPERFQREIRIAAQLQHPHILPVYDSGAGEEGILWFTMPFVEGHTLRQRLRQDGPLPVAEAVSIVSDIARALAYAHRRGVLHRDVKPENVMVGDDHVFLTDFGIAKPLDRTRDPQLTVAGMIIGTPAYMAPEQVGADSSTDHRADIYALGILAYELLVGEPPFTNLELGPLLVAHVTRDPEPVARRRPDVPPQLSDLVARCLRKDPAERWDSAEALGDALRSVLSSGPSAAPAEGEPADGGESAPADLAAARAALSRGAWREAYVGLTAANAAGALEAEDLERLAEAAWWLADGPTCVRAREQAYRRYVQRREPRGAAAVALALAEDHFHRLARSVGQGWLRRAERQLEGLPEVAERGWLHRLHMVVAFEAEGNPHEAMEHADRAFDIARRVGDTDLEALALQDRGRILVALGRVADGMALIDDAMTAATAGELTARTTGRAYCNMMSTCERLGDYGRAAEWHEAAHRWCEPHAESGYPGICRVHRAGMLRLRGALPEAEQEARRAAEELEHFLTDVSGEAFYELGEIRLRMGDHPAADAMFGEAHARGRDPQPGLALLRLAEGNCEAARTMIERSLGQPGLAALDRAKLLPALVEIAFACGAVDVAAEGASELEAITTTYTAPALVASAALARGTAELARGGAEDALAHLRRARRIWTEIDLPFELARTRFLMSRAYSALGDRDEAAMEERAALAIMSRIGAGDSGGRARRAR